jgi:hypothetical protein
MKQSSKKRNYKTKPASENEQDIFWLRILHFRLIFSLSRGSAEYKKLERIAELFINKARVHTKQEKGKETPYPPLCPVGFQTFFFPGGGWFAFVQ